MEFKMPSAYKISPIYIRIAPYKHLGIGEHLKLHTFKLSELESIEIHPNLEHENLFHYYINFFWEKKYGYFL